MEKYCVYCMSESNSDICPVCGKDRNDYEPQMHHIPPGTILGGKYAVGRVLGEGGFGITYLGKDTALDMKVAIKEYFPRSTASRSSDHKTVKSLNGSENSFERGRDRFLKEARTIAKMNKQTVFVDVTDFVQENNTAYIVMEYIEGTTLSKLVEQRGRIPADELFALIEPLFDALSKFHETELIHRDISPDNIMIEEGTVRLLDFGCAKDVSNQSETMTVTVKQDYAPIEQFSTSTPQGSWTDIYSLSATIYYCLVGTPPKRAFDRIANDTIELPSGHGVIISPAREQALIRGLSLVAQNRWQTVAEFKAALYGGSVPVQPTPSYNNYIPSSDTNIVATQYVRQVNVQQQYVQQPTVQQQYVQQPTVQQQYIQQPAMQQYVQTAPNGTPAKKKNIAVIASIAGAAAVAVIVLIIVLVANAGKNDIPVDNGGFFDTGNYASAEDFEYYEEDGGITIVKYIGYDDVLYIPPTIDGKPVLKIEGFDPYTTYKTYGRTSVRAKSSGAGKYDGVVMPLIDAWDDDVPMTATTSPFDFQSPFERDGEDTSQELVEDPGEGIEDPDGYGDEPDRTSGGYEGMRPLEAENPYEDYWGGAGEGSDTTEPDWYYVDGEPGEFAPEEDHPMTDETETTTDAWYPEDLERGSYPEYGIVWTGWTSRVIVPDSVISIGSKAFAYCTSLKEVSVPRGCYVSSDAFYNSPNVNITYR